MKKKSMYFSANGLELELASRGQWKKVKFTTVSLMDLQNYIINEQLVTPREVLTRRGNPRLGMGVQQTCVSLKIPILAKFLLNTPKHTVS